MQYTKPEIFMESFDVEDIITASSGTPGSDPTPVYDPWELEQVNPFG